MANKLKPTIRLYMFDSEPSKRYVRVDEMAKDYVTVLEEMKAFAVEAGALYKLPRVSLIHKEKVGNSALINTELFEEYLEQFREPARPLPKHVWKGEKREASYLC